jgi:hypothetical protein
MTIQPGPVFSSLLLTISSLMLGSFCQISSLGSFCQKGANASFFYEMMHQSLGDSRNARLRFDNALFSYRLMASIARIAIWKSLMLTFSISFIDKNIS